MAARSKRITCRKSNGWGPKDALVSLEVVEKSGWSCSKRAGILLILFSLQSTAHCGVTCPRCLLRTWAILFQLLHFWWGSAGRNCISTQDLPLRNGIFRDYYCRAGLSQTYLIPNLLMSPSLLTCWHKGMHLYSEAHSAGGKRRLDSPTRIWKQCEARDAVSIALGAGEAKNNRWNGVRATLSARQDIRYIFGEF